VDSLGTHAVRRPGLLLECRGEDVLGKFTNKFQILIVFYFDMRI
jgi:hypothetical protein